MTLWYINSIYRALRLTPHWGHWWGGRFHAFAVACSEVGGMSSTMLVNSFYHISYIFHSRSTNSFLKASLPSLPPNTNKKLKYLIEDTWFVDAPKFSHNLFLIPYYYFFLAKRKFKAFAFPVCHSYPFPPLSSQAAFFFHQVCPSASELAHLYQLHEDKQPGRGERSHKSVSISMSSTL